MPAASSYPLATGAETSITALVVADGAIKRAPVTKPSLINGTNLPAGNSIMTLALMRSSPLYSTGPANTSVLLNAVASMSDVGSYVFTPNTPNSLVFALQRQGTGVLFLNPGANVTINWGPYGSIDTYTQYAPTVRLKLVVQNGVGGATSDLWIAE